MKQYIWVQLNTINSEKKTIICPQLYHQATKPPRLDLYYGNLCSNGYQIWFFNFFINEKNCFVQIYFTDFFLGYEFRNYGLDVIGYSQMEFEDRPGTF